AWELHNIRKCLAAGYSRVVVCTSHPAKIKLIAGQITAHLSVQEQTKVAVIASTDLQSLFESGTQAQPTETIMKGYRVKVNYEPNATRQDLLQSIINATKKR
ncbi:MAG TPA: hypothetical protein VK671_01080, partial [Mucilaginibacter sp.]|nr:hypothetical protein [Mucilaginibacter sp.]